MRGRVNGLGQMIGGRMCLSGCSRVCAPSTRGIRNLSPEGIGIIETDSYSGKY